MIIGVALAGLAAESLQAAAAVSGSDDVIWKSDDGVARTPPLGWRSWNCFGLEVDDAAMRSVVAAMVNRSRGGVSLLDLGYSSVGVDDGWQQCGAGYEGSFHDTQVRHFPAQLKLNHFDRIARQGRLSSSPTMTEQSRKMLNKNSTCLPLLKTVSGLNLREQSGLKEGGQRPSP